MSIVTTTRPVIDGVDSDEAIIHIECCRFPVTLCGEAVESDWGESPDHNCFDCHERDKTDICPMFGECRGPS